MKREDLIATSNNSDKKEAKVLEGDDEIN